MLGEAIVMERWGDFVVARWEPGAPTSVVLPLTKCVMLNMLINLSGLQFLFLSNWDNNV